MGFMLFEGPSVPETGWAPPQVPCVDTPQPFQWPVTVASFSDRGVTPGAAVGVQKVKPGLWRVAEAPHPNPSID